MRITAASPPNHYPVATPPPIPRSPKTPPPTMQAPTTHSPTAHSPTMPARIMTVLLRWRARCFPEAPELGWMPVFNLGYLAFLFVPPVLLWLEGGESAFGTTTARVLPPTLLSIVVFLPLYLAGYRSSGARAVLCMLAIAALGYALLPYNPFANAYLIYAVGFAAHLRGRLLPRLLCVLLLLALFWAEVIWLQYPQFIGFVTAIVAFAVFFGNHHFYESMRKRAELLLTHEEVRRLAETAERERIGRDLHDLLGHTLSLVALKSDLAGKLVARDPGAAAREIAEVSRIAREALTQVRSAVTGMRAAAIAAELASAKLLLECDGVGFRYAVDDAGLDGRGLPRETETALALALREAVTNAQRHAKANMVEARFSVRAGEATLEVRDDGRGGVQQHGNGLRGMRERIEAVGGSVSVDSRPGRGTHVQVRVPLEPRP